MGTWRRVSITLGVAAVLLVGALPAQAATTHVLSGARLSVEGTIVFNPCVLDGRGEDVALHGSFGLAVDATLADGRITSVTIGMIPFVRGTGQTSGAIYAVLPVGSSTTTLEPGVDPQPEPIEKEVDAPWWDLPPTGELSGSELQGIGLVTLAPDGRVSSVRLVSVRVSGCL